MLIVVPYNDFAAFRITSIDHLTALPETLRRV